MLGCALNCVTTTSRKQLGARRRHALERDISGSPQKARQGKHWPALASGRSLCLPFLRLLSFVTLDLPESGSLQAPHRRTAPRDMGKPDLRPCREETGTAALGPRDPGLLTTRGTNDKVATQRQGQGEVAAGRARLRVSAEARAGAERDRTSRRDADAGIPPPGRGQAQDPTR